MLLRVNEGMETLQTNEKIATSSPIAQMFLLDENYQKHEHFLPTASPIGQKQIEHSKGVLACSSMSSMRDW